MRLLLGYFSTSESLTKKEKTKLYFQYRWVCRRPGGDGIVEIKTHTHTYTLLTADDMEQLALCVMSVHVWKENGTVRRRRDVSPHVQYVFVLSLCVCVCVSPSVSVRWRRHSSQVYNVHGGKKEKCKWCCFVQTLPVFVPLLFLFSVFVSILFDLLMICI